MTHFKFQQLLLIVTSIVGLASCTSQTSNFTPPRIPSVVLVHGIFENGYSFAPLKKRLERRGFDCYVPKLKHCDGSGGLHQLAVHLKLDIDSKFGNAEPISIVAFSMGGIVTREYLQNLSGAVRCENFITVSSPHHGTHAAWLYPSQGAAEMRPGSEFLQNLKNTQHRLGKIRVTSYRTPMDQVILPASSSIWDRAENREYPVILHQLMIISPEVTEDIEQRLLE